MLAQCLTREQPEPGVNRQCAELRNERNEIISCLTQFDLMAFISLIFSAVAYFTIYYYYCYYIYRSKCSAIEHTKIVTVYLS